ncbi:MAG TPA: response regulator transcription factor [Conexibacter sp.]|nr:response regulator transcription factor [Conexibacter sp.]
MPQLTAVIVDSYPLFRTGLRQLLEDDDVAVVGETANAEAGVRLVERHVPDVAIVDPDTSTPSGLRPLELIRALLVSAPTTRLLVLARTLADHDPVDIIRIGGSCYLSKDTRPETILAGVRAAAAGETLIAPGVAAALVQRLRAIGAGEGPAPHSVLSDREQEVLRLIAIGLDNDAIASKLFISRHTVKNHISNILLKLEVTNRVQAAVRATQEAMI